MVSFSKNVNPKNLSAELPPLGVITGVGKNLPEQVIDNHHFAKYLETNDEWIKERSGIEKRRWASDGLSLVDLLEPACAKAISSSGLSPKDIDGVIVATSTSDNLFPSAACEISHRLGINGPFAFDLLAACSGFLYALLTAQSHLRNGLAENILVCGAEIFSRVVDHQDRSTCILFGDGAGAIVLSKNDSQKRGIIAGRMLADGKLGETLSLASHAPSGEDGPFVKMQGKDVFKSAVRHLSDVSKTVAGDAGHQISDLDHYISHQANKRILQAVAKNIGLSEDKVSMNLANYGNTSAASIPILLAECVEENKIKEGDLVMFSAFGGGATWGALLMSW